MDERPCTGAACLGMGLARVRGTWIYGLDDDAPPPMPHGGPSVEARKQTMAMMSRLSMLCPVT